MTDEYRSSKTCIYCYQQVRLAAMAILIAGASNLLSIARRTLPPFTRELPSFEAPRSLATNNTSFIPVITTRHQHPSGCNDGPFSNTEDYKT
ncbi:hypothetical protein BGX26_009600 [Mortierella sp. AD094]|nr:hypothetical protein BGX26_009600 [Mortierella sp. AD094]